MLDDMTFTRLTPSPELNQYVECFWIVADQNQTPTIQKIIPDGFPEMIFHFGDPYMIKLDSKWVKQSPSLLGGQITSHFFLKNTGTSDILGIKFRPAAIGVLFDAPMYQFTNRVVSLTTTRNGKLTAFAKIIKNASDHNERINAATDYLLKSSVGNHTLINSSVEKILSSNGLIAVNEICNEVGCSERQLERLFKRYVGLSPKLYSRIVRFAYIFQHVSGSKKMNGSELGNASGYYDQSHFIRNFKAFTGEDPSSYVFDETNLANFFLKKR